MALNELLQKYEVGRIELPIPQQDGTTGYRTVFYTVGKVNLVPFAFVEKAPFEKDMGYAVVRSDRYALLGSEPEDDATPSVKVYRGFGNYGPRSEGSLAKALTLEKKRQSKLQRQRILSVAHEYVTAEFLQLDKTQKKIEQFTQIYQQELKGTVDPQNISSIARKHAMSRILAEDTIVRALKKQQLSYSRRFAENYPEVFDVAIVSSLKHIDLSLTPLHRMHKLTPIRDLDDMEWESLTMFHNQVLEKPSIHARGVFTRYTSEFPGVKTSEELVDAIVDRTNRDATRRQLDLEKKLQEEEAHKKVEQLKAKEKHDDSQAQKRMLEIYQENPALYEKLSNQPGFDPTILDLIEKD